MYWTLRLTRRQFEKILSFIEHGKIEGTTLLTGGKRLGDKGYYIEPSIFVDVKEDMLIAKDEIFGAVMALMKFKFAKLLVIFCVYMHVSNSRSCKTIEEAIEKVDNTAYGLAAGMVTKNLDVANTVSRSIRACWDHLDQPLFCFRSGLPVWRV
ncbi:Aldehyde dehydrogenase family 2 member C4 [Morella rubra]|uniref:Aldehyde dehydrogenase family 2 member C4 n=1 Tax=Morella rubra TaxID=262757 RepID=A0A6A1VBH6_9ROSI|nr:Aldehyde dehydrogenase family 2 member C4 [Morella rubra]